MLTFVLMLFWPLLLQAAPTQLPEGARKALSIDWEAVGTIETGFDHLAAVTACALPVRDAGCLIAADSSGQIGEWRWNGTGWDRVRVFSVGEPLTTLVSGRPRADKIWHVFAGARSGKVFELSRNSVGWTTSEIGRYPGPIVDLQASDPGNDGISQLMVIDADGGVTNLWVSDAGDWIERRVPGIKGGATEVCFDYARTGLRIVVAGPKGELHRFTQDETGHWTGELWATMASGPLDMVASADPTMKDVAVYYSGQDGIFRYLFHGYTNDDKARVPVAAGVNHLIGKGSQRRFNEFFGVSGDSFCKFEFEFTDQAWQRVPLKTMVSPVVGTAFGAGRRELLLQMYVATADGTIHEFYRGFDDSYE